MADGPGSIAERLSGIRERIESACRRAGRDSSSVTLLAVSKGHGIEAVLEAAAAGARDFGENYLNELAEKAPRAPNLRWHYQGALQRRKIRDIVKLSSSILSVSREEELLEVEKRAERAIECFIEVNIAGEPSKGGVAPGELERIVEISAGLAKARVVGLMAIPPAESDPVAARRWFDETRKLADQHRFEQVSMGMSGDFEEAVAAGSTMVRIGTAIFGPRPHKV